MSAEVPLFTPVNVLTGFLGSGKTTLLQRLLRSPRLHDTAVLINEFGEIGLDHHLLQTVDETTVLLQSGCLCCTIRGDLAKAIRELHEKRDAGSVPPYRRLVIETTGLADPLPVLTTITADPVLRHHYRLGNVITTLDAVNAQAQLNTQPESLKQAAVADRLVITKTDLVTTEQTQALSARVRTLNPAAAILVADPHSDQADHLLSQDAFDLASKTEEVRRWFAQEIQSPRHADHTHDVNRHSDDIQSFCLTFDQPLDWTAFGLWLTMLLNRHGTHVLRVKGILNVAGEAAPVAVHAVQQLVHPPIHLERWPDADRRSKLVFITQALDPAPLRRSLLAFINL